MTTKEKSPWIRVSEQLPPEGEEVLVRLKNYNYSPRIMFYRKRDKIWVEDDGINIPIASIKLFSNDLFVDFIETFDDASKFGEEIARRWNEFKDKK